MPAPKRANSARVIHHRPRAQRILLQVGGRKPVAFTPRLLIYGFLGLIALGTILLILPFSTVSGQSTGIVNSLFTSTSAVCVTGLVIADTGTYWSLFGQIVILLLIQIGGFGIMTGTTLILLAAGRRITLQDRLLVGESLGMSKTGDVLKLVKRMAFFILIAEGAGALIFFIRFCFQTSPGQAIWRAIFHSVSAFNNAGFDLFGNLRSLQGYQGDALVILTTAVLIIMGGLSFIVLNEAAARKRFNRLSLDSRIVLVTTFSLLLLGTVVTLCIEFLRPEFAQMPTSTKLLSSFFHSVTSRTAGFSTLAAAQMVQPLLFFTMFLMFIGGAAGSTAGGVKVNTFGVLMATVWSSIRGRQHAGAFGREFAKSQIQRIIAVITLAAVLIGIIVFFLSITEKADFLSLLFEVVSAFGTVGLTTGITPSLSISGKVLITITMFIGRLGPAYLAVSLIQSERPSTYRHPEETVRIG